MAAAMRIGAVLVSAMLVGLGAGCAKEPQPWEVASSKANKLLKEYKYADAAGAFEEALRLHPNPAADLKLYEKTAFAFMKAGNPDKAAEWLHKTMDLRPTKDAKLETLHNIAGIYLESAKNPAKAEEYFAAALQLEPNDEQSLMWLGEIASVRGGARAQAARAEPEFLDKAIAIYDQLISINPKAPIPYVNKRIAMMKQLNYYAEQKKLADAVAAANKRNRAVVAEHLAKADEYVEKYDALKGKLDETTRILVEVNKAAKAAKEAAALAEKEAAAQQ